MSKSFDEYLNDPRIKDESMNLRITHAMRFRVQNDTAGMTPAERTAYYNGSSDHLRFKTDKSDVPEL
jgi:hypothetical protein